MRHPSGYFALYLLACALSGPARAADPVTTEVDPESSTIEGPSWQLLAYRSDTALANVLTKSRPTRFQFAGGRMSGNTGCNQLTGAYTLDGSIVTIGTGLAATQMGCPQPLMKQEKAIIQTLKSVATYRREGDRMELLDAHGAALLQFELPRPTALEGHAWTLESYDNGQQTLVAPVKGNQISLTFEDRGRLGGSDGCNRYLSGFTLEGEVLRIGPIATTRMACPATDGRAAQASAYAAALGRVAGYRIEADRLTLLDAGGKPAARFRAEAIVAPPKGE